MESFVIIYIYRTGADPELLRGGTNPWGRLPNILIIFSEKPYEIKEILVRGGGRAGCAPPPKSATVEASVLELDVLMLIKQRRRHHLFW